MKATFDQSIQSYRLLCTFANLTSTQKLLKGIILPFALIIHTALFLVTWIFLGIERLFAPVFKLFLIFHFTLLKKRQLATIWQKRLIGVITVLGTLVFLPFVLVYYLAMLFKALFKYMMRGLIRNMDFGDSLGIDVFVFDDQPEGIESGTPDIFKDAARNEALGKMLESYLSNTPDDEDVMDDDTNTR